MSGIRSQSEYLRELEKSGVGYSQGATQRWSWLNKKDRKINKNEECDCSTSSFGAAFLAGLMPEELLKGTAYTGNLAQKFKASGFFKVLKFKSLSQFKEGDHALTPGRHVATVIDKGQMFSAQSNEKGNILGGRAGDQTGREVVIRGIYNRPGGWDYIVRPYPASHWKTKVLQAYSVGKSTADAMTRLNVLATFDGPLWRKFIEQCMSWDKGMVLVYDGAKLEVPSAGHTYIVLGSNTADMRNRCDVALSGLRAYPNSSVIVSGGTKRGDVTEAEYMRKYLAERGIADVRIIKEEKSFSTIGNAKGVMAILKARKFNTYTLASDASHLRRASVDFLAAKLAIETTENKTLLTNPTQPLAVNDYGSKPVKTEGPVDATTRLTISKEAASILGLSI